MQPVRSKSLPKGWVSHCCGWAALLAAGLLAVAACAPACAAESAWELSPYRIKLLVAVDASGAPAGASEQELAERIAERAVALVGGSWRMEAAPAPPALRHKLLTSLSKLATADLPAGLPGGDKLMLVAVRQEEDGWQIRAREFDVVTGLWNSTTSVRARQRATLADDALRAVLAAFAPQARIESTEGQAATFRLRAGGLARANRDLPAFAPGAAFRPVLVKCDSQGRLTAGSAELVPWTYLTPTGSSGPLITCRVDTGLGGPPLPDYHPHRARLAVAVTPSADSTELKLVNQADPPAPLEGCEVLEETPASAADQPANLELLGRSNRAGLVTIPPGKSAVRMLLVRRGASTLARLPVAVGLTPELVLPLAGGERGLAAASGLAALEDALVDLAARREVLAARIRAAIQRGDKAGGEKLLAELRSAVPLDKLLVQLDQQAQSIPADETGAALKSRLDALRQLLEKLPAASPADHLETELKAAAAK